ncbi:MAG: asparagine synthase C-terminal domain-containing protein, partial [Candidatus Omnitrophica bacterium]|nr:asparagine synthase C-terminal domain-containing protein [Candidatus Omnitrophota bacterium]
LFCGYPGWKTLLRLQGYNDLPVPSFIKRLGLMGLKLAGKGESMYYEWLSRGTRGLPLFWGGAEAFSAVEKNKLLSGRLRQKFAGLSSWEAVEPVYRRFQEKAWEKSYLNWMTYMDLNLRLPELLLMRVDKMSMGSSLEGRVPFLDHKFVELAMGIPTAIKIKNGTLKYILKKSVRGVIPDEIIFRKKQGFGVPIYEWFFSKLGDVASKELMDFCEKTDFLDKEEVKNLITRRQGVQLWYLLNFALWWKEFID